MDRRFRKLTAAIVPAQEADRYLNTRFGREGQEPRYLRLAERFLTSARAWRLR